MTSDKMLKWTDSSYQPPSLKTIRNKVICVLKRSSYEAETTKNTETLGNTKHG
ncbi:hypothetical protein Hanom_Chr01g00019771 [Helianthus anomalus]